jgi:TRAP-type C4-dicarboxylate transport system substrate-binding protein
MRQLWGNMETKSKAAVVAGGASITPIDRAPFQAAMKPVYDQFITDPKLQALLTKIADMQKE